MPEQQSNKSTCLFVSLDSRLSNRDKIMETLPDGWSITAGDNKPIPDLFDPGYTLPPSVATDGENIHA